MAVAIAQMILIGLILDYFFRKIKLPGLIGLLILGVFIGPHFLNILDPVMQSVAADWRIIALVVILLRAGFEMSREALSKVGVRALLMSFIPCVCEVSAVTLVAPHLLGLTYLESAILGSVLGAVSPAVVVPLMVKFIEEGRGEDKGVPTLVLAGSSCDDAVAIVLCSSFIGMYVGESVNMAWKIASVPISIITGIAIGLLLGVLFYKLFDKFNPRATKRVLILLSISILLLHFQHTFEHIFPYAALLSVMAIGFIILEKREKAAHEISAKLGKVWVFAQILLFIIVGTQVNVPIAINAGLTGAAVIIIGLIGRSLGVQLCLVKSIFNIKERLFITISYLPKATVQAAIGATPLIAMKAAGMNIAPGELILAVAVLSILITAPTGAILIASSAEKLLKVATKKDNPALMAIKESNE